MPKFAWYYFIIEHVNFGYGHAVPVFILISSTTYSAPDLKLTIFNVQSVAKMDEPMKKYLHSVFCNFQQFLSLGQIFSSLPLASFNERKLFKF